MVQHHAYVLPGTESDAELKERGKLFKRGGSFRKAPVPKRSLAKANEDDSLISGHLLKLSGDTWQKLWFVVGETEAGSGLYVMYTYEASEDTRATRTDPLLGYEYDINVEVIVVHSPSPQKRFSYRLG